MRHRVLFVCSPVCLFVCLSVCLSLSAHCLSVCLSVWLYLLTVCLSVCLSVGRPRPQLYLTVCLSVCRQAQATAIAVHGGLTNRQQHLGTIEAGPDGARASIGEQETQHCFWTSLDTIHIRVFSSQAETSHCRLGRVVTSFFGKPNWYKQFY